MRNTWLRGVDGIAMSKRYKEKRRERYYRLRAYAIADFDLETECFGCEDCEQRELDDELEYFAEDEPLY